MSQENVEFAWRASRAWNDGGIDALLEYLDADVEWHPPSESMEPGVYRGHDGVRDYLDGWAKSSRNGASNPSKSSMSTTTTSSRLSA